MSSDDSDVEASKSELIVRQRRLISSDDDDESGTVKDSNLIVSHADEKVIEKSSLLISDDDADETTQKSEPFIEDRGQTSDSNKLNNSNVSQSRSKINRQPLKSKLLTDSDVEYDEGSNSFDDKSENNSILATKKHGHVKPLLTASDIESDDSDVPMANTAEQHLQESGSDEEENCIKENNIIKGSRKKQRKHEQKLDEKLLIKSESQRMEREMAMNLPYHRPKQRSLREFLSRKKDSLPGNCLRSTASSMIAKWKKIDESIKEVPAFFKSDSEDDEEDKNESVVVPPQCVDLQVPEAICSQEGRMNFINNFDVTGEIGLGIETDEICSSNVAKETILKQQDLEIPSEVGLSHDGKDLGAQTGEEDSIAQAEEKDLSSDVVKQGSQLQAEEMQINISTEPSAEDKSTKPENNSPADVEPALLPDYSEKPVQKVGHWLEDLVRFEKLDSLKKARFSPSILNNVPRLSCEADDIIDLEPESNTKATLQSGARQLMERLLNRNRAKENSCVEVVTSSAQVNDSGNIDGIIIEKIVTNQKPPKEKISTLQQFREQMKRDIEVKWEEDYKKRCAQVSATEKSGFEDEVEDAEAEEEEEVEEEMTDSESEPEEDDIALEDKPRKFCAFGDSEAEESDGEADDEQQDDSDIDEDDDKIDEDDTGDHESIAGDAGKQQEMATADFDNGEDNLDCSLPAFQPGGGMLHGGSELTQITQPLPLKGLSPHSSPILSTKTDWPLTERVANENQTPLRSENDTEGLESVSVAKRNLFSLDTVPSGSVPLFPVDDADIDDPFAFVSGVFPEDKENMKPLPSQTQTRRIIPAADSDDDTEDAVGDVAQDIAADLAEEVPEVTTPRGVIADDEEKVSARKKKKRLAFSDDEESEGEKEAEAESGVNEEAARDTEGEDSAVEDDGDEVAGPIDYDSEENEIPAVNPKEFLENEAELSESEWSGDEDERGLDALDIEAGDADVLDEDQVQSQLGRIHMRRMLDQDARDVRILQELLFEDGDLHEDGKKRDRKFRWKNLTGFDRTDERLADGSESEGETEQTETELAKIRHEKAQFLLQLQKEGKELPHSNESLDEDPLLQLGKRLLQQIRSKPLDKNLVNNQCRGSFLSKDSDFLSRLARTAGVTKDGPLGPKNSRNFVFVAQSPEKEKPVVIEETAVSIKVLKRKSGECQGDELVKRTKVMRTVTTGRSLLDQLH